MHRTALAVEAQTMSHAPAGTGTLHVARTGTRSVVRRAFATSPLKLLTPRSASSAWVYTSTYGGGLVDGDQVHLTTEVGADAVLWLSTQASTKVYRSPRGTSARLDASVGERALLVLAPDPVVCFTGARYRQIQHIDLHESAGLVLLDWFTAGRRGTGERWRFEHFSSRTSIECAGRLVFVDGLELSERDGDLRHRMGRFDVVAAVVLGGPSLRAHVDRAVEVVDATAVTRRSDVIMSASKLSTWGCVLRIAGTSVEEVGAIIRNHLAFVPELLGDDPWLRKW